MTSTPTLRQFAREHHRVLQAPAAFRIVDRRAAHEQRLLRRPGGAHRARDFERKAHAVLQAAAVAVRAPVGDGRQEAVQQVAVGAVHLGDIESGGLRAARCCHEGVEQGREIRVTGGRGRLPALGNRGVRGPDDRPAVVASRNVVAGERAIAVPGARHACLAPGVRELDRRDGALCTDEGRDARQAGNLRVRPEPDVAVGDAAARLDGGRLDKDDARAALCELAQVHEMPVVHQALQCAVLAHRGDHDAIARANAAQLDRFEQQGGGHGRSLWFTIPRH